MQKHAREKAQWIADKNVHELTYAAHKNCTRRALKLLGLITSGSLKCDLNHLGYQKDSALYHAVLHNNAEVVRALLAHQADPRVQCPTGQTILLFVQTTPSVTEEIKELISERSEELNVDIKEAQALKERRKKVALETFIQEVGHGAFTTRTIDFLKTLKPCLIDGHSPVAHAIRAKKPKLVTQLCHTKAFYEDEKDDLVMLAYDTDDAGILKVVVKSPCAKEDQLKKLLKVALRRHRFDILSMLKEIPHFYASIFKNLIQEDDLGSATNLCEFSAELLTDRQAGDCTIQAVRSGRSKFAQLMLNYYPDVTQYADEEGMTALMHAAQQSNPQLFESLCKAGADPKARDVLQRSVQSFIPQKASSKELFDLYERAVSRQSPASTVGPSERDTLLAQGWTKQMIDVYQDDRQALELSSTDELNKSGCSGLSPLHIAVIHNKQRCFDYLTSKPALNINAIDNQAKIALMYAAAQGNNRMVQRLLERGASLLIFDSDGKSATQHIPESEKGKKLAGKLAQALYEEITKKTLLGQVQDLPALLQRLHASEDEHDFVYFNLVIKGSGESLDRVLSSSSQIREAMKKTLGSFVDHVVRENIRSAANPKKIFEVNESDHTNILDGVKQLLHQIKKDKSLRGDMLDSVMQFTSNVLVTKPGAEPLNPKGGTANDVLAKFYIIEAAGWVTKLDDARLEVLLRHQIVDFQRLMFCAVIFECESVIQFIVKRFPHEFLSWAVSDVQAQTVADILLQSQEHTWYHTAARKGKAPPITPSILAWMLKKKESLKYLFACSAPDLMRNLEPHGWPTWVYIINTTDLAKDLSQGIMAWIDRPEIRSKLANNSLLNFLASQGHLAAIIPLLLPGGFLDCNQADAGGDTIVSSLLRGMCDYKNHDFFSSLSQEKIELGCVSQLKLLKNNYNAHLNVQLDGMSGAEYALRRGFFWVANFLLPYCEPGGLSGEAVDILVNRYPIPELLRVMRNAPGIIMPATLLMRACFAERTDLVEILVNTPNMVEDTTVLLPALAQVGSQNCKARVIKALIGRRKVSHLAESPSVQGVLSAAISRGNTGTVILLLQAFGPDVLKNYDKLPQHNVEINSLVDAFRRLADFSLAPHSPYLWKILIKEELEATADTLIAHQPTTFKKSPDFARKIELFMKGLERELSTALEEWLTEIVRVRRDSNRVAARTFDDSIFREKPSKELFIIFWLHAALSDNKTACGALGKLYYTGDLFKERHLECADYWLSLSVNHLDPNVQRRLTDAESTCCYCAAWVCELTGDAKKAFFYHSQLAAGSADDFFSRFGYFKTGCAAKYGRGTSQDIEQAKRSFLKVIDTTNVSGGVNVRCSEIMAEAALYLGEIVLQEGDADLAEGYFRGSADLAIDDHVKKRALEVLRILEANKKSTNTE